MDAKISLPRITATKNIHGKERQANNHHFPEMQKWTKRKDIPLRFL